jgi:hypothetical protein
VALPTLSFGCLSVLLRSFPLPLPKTLLTSSSDIAGTIPAYVGLFSLIRTVTSIQFEPQLVVLAVVVSCISLKFWSFPDVNDNNPLKTCCAITIYLFGRGTRFFSHFLAIERLVSWPNVAELLELQGPALARALACATEGTPQTYSCLTEVSA